MKPPFSYVPLLPVVASLAAGVVLFRVSDNVVIPILVMIMATGLFFVKREYYGSLLCGMAIGWWVAANDVPEVCPVDLPSDDYTYFAVADEGKDTDSGYEISGKVKGYVSPSDSVVTKVRPFKVKLHVPAVNMNISYGDSIFFRGAYYKSTPNPDLPDEFNTGNIATAGTVRFRVKENDIEVAGNHGGIKNKLYEVRRRLAGAILSCRLSEGCTNFLLASLLGDGSWVSREERGLYSRTGMAHILALSGAHVGLIMSMLCIALFPFSTGRKFYIKSTVIILLLWVYVVMTGGSASVTRAVIMVSLMLIGSMLKRPYSGMNALCMAAILILLFSPDSLFRPGFQLSFMAVASIGLLSKHINPFYNTVFYRPAMWIILPIAATTGTFALLLYHFHFFPISFILSAPVATLLLTTVMIGGILLIICSLTGLPYSVPADITDYLFGIAYRYLGITDSLPLFSVENVRISVLTAIILTLFPFILAYYIKYRKKTIVAVWAASVCLTLTFDYLIRPEYPDKEVFLTDDPYNLCIAVKSGQKMYLITDADSVQSEFIVEQFVATHPDYLSKRRIAEVSLICDTTNTPVARRKGRVARVNGEYMIILTDKREVYPSPYPTDYLIVCDGFRGDIIEAADTFKPRNIVLTRHLNHRLRQRYFRELKSMGYDPVDLSENGTMRL